MVLCKSFLRFPVCIGSEEEYLRNGCVLGALLPDPGLRSAGEGSIGRADADRWRRLGAVYNAGYFSMSTWIPFIWGWINVLVLIISSFTMQGGL